MNKKIEAAFNKHLNAELYSAYLYLSMAAYFESISLKGFAHWMEIQGQEELTHVQKFFYFINERNGRVLLEAVEGPPTEWKEPLQAFESTLEHEQLVSSKINALVDLSLAERDHASNSFLQWFVAEQVEEEASVKEVIDKLKLVKDGDMLFQLDKDLATRVFQAPAPAQ